MLKILNKLKEKNVRLREKCITISLNINKYNQAFGRVLIDCSSVGNNQKYHIILIDEDRFDPNVFSDMNDLCRYRKSCLKKTIVFASVKENFKFKNKKSFQIKIRRGFTYHNSKFTVFNTGILKVVKSLGTE